MKNENAPSLPFTLHPSLLPELESLQPELTRIEKGLVETLQAELDDVFLYVELVNVLGAIKSFKLRHGEMLQAFYNSRQLTPNEALMAALRER